MCIHSECLFKGDRCLLFTYAHLFFKCSRFEKIAKNIAFTYVNL